MHFDSPYFSVVIPAYNRADRISSVLDSVLKQTFVDWELIVVDDGSDDVEKLVQVIESKQNNKIRLIRRENGGGGRARNSGINAARGKFIALLDSDDFFEADKLQVMYEKTVLSGLPDLFLYSFFKVDRGLDKYWIKPDRLLQPNVRVDDYLTCTSGWIQTSTMVVDANLAKRVQFSEVLPSSQDTDFAIRCFLHGANFVFVDKVLVVMTDIYDPNRVSKQKKVAPLIDWSYQMINQGMSLKSSFGYRGWQCARIISASDKVKALKFFFSAIVRGCYDFKTAIRIFLQIVIKEATYQKLMTMIVSIIGKSK